MRNKLHQSKHIQIDCTSLLVSLTGKSRENRAAVRFNFGMRDDSHRAIAQSYMEQRSSSEITDCIADVSYKMRTT